jgi:primase-polymerase (primpol)-like protein
VWQWELRKGKSGKEKWTKPPRQARDPAYNARSNDPDSWGTYDEAVATVAAGNADGIGYMLLGSGIGAIDLDHVEDRDIGKLKRWAEQLQAEARRRQRSPSLQRLAHHWHRQRPGCSAPLRASTGAGVEF